MKKKIFVLSVNIVLMCMCACASDRQEEYITPRQLANQQSEMILQGIIDEDVEPIKGVFAPYAKEIYSDLDVQIEGMFAFIDGEIISYDEPDGGSWSRAMTEGEGTVKESIMGRVANVKTSTGKTYRIGHGGYSVYKKHPEYVGVTNITIFDEDMYDPETGYPEGAKYRVSFPETWQE